MLLAFAACSPGERLIEVSPQIPPTLLEPCLVSRVAPETVRALASAYARTVTALDCANGKIVGIGKIVGSK